MHMTKYLSTATALLATAVLSLGNTTHAETYIKGTQVSYDIDISKDKTNESSVYIDEAHDTNNKNFVQFSCEDGAPIFYLHSSQNLYSQQQYDKDSTAPIKVSVDGTNAVSFETVSTSSDDKPDLTTMALVDKFDAQILRLFQSARNTVVITVNTPSNKAQNFTFYPKGLAEAFSKVNLCQ